MDAAGDLFIADTYNNRIREVNASTHVITTVAGNGTAGYSGDGGLATTAELDDPYGIAVDAAGDLFIADTFNSVIREVNASTHDITTVAGNGYFGYSGDGGLATAAELDEPIGVAVDASGDLFIADIGNNVIREVNASTHDISHRRRQRNRGLQRRRRTGHQRRTGRSHGRGGGRQRRPVHRRLRQQRHPRGHREHAGHQPPSPATEPQGYSGDGGLATSAELDDPFGVAVDASGDLFIADSYNSVIREVNAARRTSAPSPAMDTAAMAATADWPPMLNSTGLAAWRWTPTAICSSPTPATTASARSTPARTTSPPSRAAVCPTNLPATDLEHCSLQRRGGQQRRSVHRRPHS